MLDTYWDSTRLIFATVPSDSLGTGNARFHPVAAISEFVFVIRKLLQTSSGVKTAAERGPHAAALHAVEGLALVLLCSCRLSTRRLAVAVLKEIRSLFAAVGQSEVRSQAAR